MQTWMVETKGDLGQNDSCLATPRLLKREILAPGKCFSHLRLARGKWESKGYLCAALGAVF
jgi:hypothetical protein